MLLRTGSAFTLAVLSTAALGCGASSKPKTTTSTSHRAVTTTAQHAMTYHDAYVLKLGTSYPAVIKQFGAPIAPPLGAPTTVNGMSCVYYEYAGHPSAAWELCFKHSRLAVLSTRL